MTKGTSPYNFVPLNEHVYLPEWGSQVSHDVPFSDGESGTIEVRWRNVSPLFVGGPDSKNEKIEGKTIKCPVQTRDGRYFIPGTSLRGMLRSVMEVMSFARLRQLNDGFYGVRVFNKREKDHSLHGTKPEPPLCGWLTMEGDNLYLRRCIEGYERVEHSTLRKHYPQFDKDSTVDKRQEAVGHYPIWKEDKDYRVVCTGPMHSKKKEYLFPISCQQKERLDERVAQAFLDVHATHPQFENYFLKRLKRGEEIGVFFRVGSKNEVKHLGLAAVYRTPYLHSVKEGVRQTSVEGADLCDLIWGYIPEKSGTGLKGRVVISHAFPTHKDLLIADNQLVKTSGVLGEPKASFFPYYLKSTGGEYGAYDDKIITLAGRKRYRIHTGATTTKLPQGNDNEKVLTTFYALPAGTEFTFRIIVHNLRPIELGAVLSALTFHGQKGVWHNLGLAKAHGFGKFEILDVQLSSNFVHKASTYLEAFEEEMSLYGRENEMDKG